MSDRPHFYDATHISTSEISPFSFCGAYRPTRMVTPNNAKNAPWVERDKLCEKCETRMHENRKKQEEL